MPRHVPNKRAARASPNEGDSAADKFRPESEPRNPEDHLAPRGMTVRKAVQQVVLPYVVFSVAWIFFSDRALNAMVSDPQWRIWWALGKGWLFVAATAVLLFMLVRRAVGAAHQAHAEIAEAEERFRSLVTTTAAVVWRTDGAGQTTEATRSLIEFTGMSADELRQQDGWLSAVHPEDRARAAEGWRKAAERGTDYYSEYRLRRNDGAWRDMIARGAAIRNSDGTAREWIGTCVDVTEFKAADEAARFQARLLDTTGESIVATDPGGRIIYMNRFAAAQFGWSAEEAIGRDIMELTVPMQSRQQAEEMIDAIRRGKTWSGEFIAHRRGGSMFPIRASNTPLLNEAGELVAIIVVARDISERQESERALRRSEERYRATFDQAAVGVGQIAFDGTFERVNPRLCELLGYPADELLKVKVTDITHPDDVTRTAQLVRKLSAQERDFFAIEKRYLRKDGGLIWALSTVSLMRDREGRPQSLIAIVEDISVQKEAQRALGQREAELRALTARLNAAREEEAKRIARELHDELGQVLTAITMAMADAQRQLADRNGTLPADEMQRHLASMRALLDQAMATTRRVCTELRPALLDELGLVPALERQACDFEARTGVSCRIKVPERPAEIGGDVATALFRILQELLTNVARHGHATEVTVDLTTSGEEICLTVQDNGRGVTEAEASKSSGLGLVGIRERALALGGRVSFEGAEGDGTRVRVVVPQRTENGSAG